MASTSTTPVSDRKELSEWREHMADCQAKELSLAERKAFRVNAHGDNPAENRDIEKRFEEGEL